MTLSLQLPKLAFLFAENQEFVGEWELLDIGLSEDAIEEMATDYSLLEAEDMQDLLKPRNKFAHKGDFGRALLIAGSQGMAERRCLPQSLPALWGRVADDACALL